MARELGKRAKGRASKVALTVDADDATLANLIEALQPDILQLHGKETVARLRDIKQTFGLPVMKAIAVATPADLASLPGYAAVADRILFDAHAPKGATRPGGLGAVFDWHVLENLDLKLPFMVSGGLNAGNVAEAVRVTRTGGVDVSSGVERTPGIKDPEMIRAFIRAARAIDLASPLPARAGRGSRGGAAI
jgi:phosphoribosylanthranilate isomerase